MFDGKYLPLRLDGEFESFSLYYCTMISATEALSLIRTTVRPLQAVTTSLEHSLGMALAEPITSPVNVPPFDNSAMDGYAIHAVDTFNVPAKLRIVGEVAAGFAGSLSIGTGECAAIMTGAKIPDGCDAVIQHELVEINADGTISLQKSVKSGHNIRRAGADIAAGQRVFEIGHLLRPQELGVLASIGKQFVSAFKRPSVAILATGNELVAIDKPLRDGTIRNSNAYAIAAAVTEHGADVVNLGIARDDAAELRAKLVDGLRSDMLITIGGVSAGKYDLVINELKALGVETIFWKVNIKPGMPLFFGILQTGRGITPVFGLPGNPVSSMVTFLQFVCPALDILAGKSLAMVVPQRAKLVEAISKGDGKRHFVRGRAEIIDGTLTVRTTGSQISNIMTSLARANCLIILPEEFESANAGAEVEIQWL